MNFQDLIAKSIIQIKESNEFFGALMLFSEFKLSKEIPTAATNGKDVLINEEFFNSLSSSEQNGLILHEVLHMALLHVQRMGGRDLKKWNIAADYVVNDLILRNTNFKLPAGAIKSSHGEYWDKSVEFIYDKLGSKDTKSFTQYDLIEPDNMEKFRPLYDKYLDLTDAHLDAAVEYISMLPYSQFRLRAACMLPVLIGQRTVTLLRDGNILDSSDKIKVTRDEMKSYARKLLRALIIPGGVKRLLEKNKDKSSSSQ